MAEIPVEKKRNKAWLWIIPLIILAALLIWWISDNDDRAYTDRPVAQETSDMARTAANRASDLTVSAILANPASYIGRDDFSADVSTPEVPTDRGFWVEQDGKRMFAIVIDEPRERPIDINPGQNLRITNGMVRDAEFLKNLPGEPIDEDTRSLAESQGAFLVVDENNIEITSRPPA